MTKQPPTKKPEWHEKGKDFPSMVVGGVEGGHDGLSEGKHVTVRQTSQQHLSIDDYVKGVLENNRTILARAITLIESNSPKHKDFAQAVLQKLLPHTGKAIRIGITGVPGAGKSSFIEAFGTMLCEQGHKVAVLAVDPSSSITRGSILGDKTRMERLSVHQNSFIRPSPSSGTLGGVTRKTRETMLACEAAGFDVILVETVGVGQSEATVRSMVDFFLLLTITGAGDELQNIKKGVIELADAIVINKADGDNIFAAENLASEFNRALHYLVHYTKGWETKAYTCSAITGAGIRELWDLVNAFEKATKSSGQFVTRRQEQLLEWVDNMVIEDIKTKFYQNNAVKELLPTLQDQVLKGELPATSAALQLLEAFEHRSKY